MLGYGLGMGDIQCRYMDAVLSRRSMDKCTEHRAEPVDGVPSFLTLPATTTIVPSGTMLPVVHCYPSSEPGNRGQGRRGWDGRSFVSDLVERPCL